MSAIFSTFTTYMYCIRICFSMCIRIRLRICTHRSPDFEQVFENYLPAFSAIFSVFSIFSHFLQFQQFWPFSAFSAEYGEDCWKCWKWLKMLEGSLLFLKDYQANLPSIIFSIFQHFQQFLALSAIFSRALNPKPHWLRLIHILHWLWASFLTLRQVVMAGGGGAAGAALPRERDQG